MDSSEFNSLFFAGAFSSIIMIKRKSWLRQSLQLRHQSICVCCLMPLCKTGFQASESVSFNEKKPIFHSKSRIGLNAVVQALSALLK